MIDCGRVQDSSDMEIINMTDDAFWNVNTI